jgi:hypothetical protein
VFDCVITVRLEPSETSAYILEYFSFIFLYGMLSALILLLAVHAEIYFFSVSDFT